MLTDDGRRSHWYTISSTMSLRLRWAKNAQRFTWNRKYILLGAKLFQYIVIPQVFVSVYFCHFVGHIPGPNWLQRLSVDDKDATCRHSSSRIFQETHLGVTDMSLNGHSVLCPCKLLSKLSTGSKHKRGSRKFFQKGSNFDSNFFLVNEGREDPSTTIFVCLFVWFDSLRPLNNLSVMRDGSSWVEPVLS